MISSPKKIPDASIDNASVSTIEPDDNQNADANAADVKYANTNANDNVNRTSNRPSSMMHESNRRGNDDDRDSKRNNMSSYPKKKKKSALQSRTAATKQSNATKTSRKIVVQLKELYKQHIKPIEVKYGLYNFCLPTNAEMHDSEFDAKPMVLLLGQYSTGKTTFIRHLVGGDYPSMHIGPEPTTDRFTALIHGLDDDSDGSDMNTNEHDTLDYDMDIDSVDDNSTINNPNANINDDMRSSVHSNPNKLLNKRWKQDGVNKAIVGKTVKGNSLTVLPELPFSSLAAFGSGFLSHFVGSITPAPLLEHITLIDTPGVLSGEKQRLSRSYDFAKASRWFADRSDLILLLFDAHKLDISDELKDVIETIRPHNDDKIRCVLNKADGVTREQLVRVYGSLMWSMGKIFNSPEVVRVYTGSYWDEPLVHDDFENMFENDEWLLINELANLPQSCAERKVNEIVKRIRIIKVHVCILSYLKDQMPRWFGKKKTQEALISDLEQIFDIVRIEYNLSVGDFPDVKDFRQCLADVEDFSSFMSADSKTLKVLDDLILTQIPNIMKGSAGITDSNTPRKTLKKRSGKTPRKQDLEIDVSIAEKEENNMGPLMKKPTYEQPQPVMAYIGMLLFALVLGYIAIFLFVQQDITNVMGLPDYALEHFAGTSKLIEEGKVLIENHIYDSRKFEL